MVSPALADDQVDLARMFRLLGVTPNIAVAPPLRSGDLTWLVLASLPLAAFLNALGTKIGEESYAGLRELVVKASSRPRRIHGSPPALLLHDERTGTVIELDSNLPDEAYRALLEEDLSKNAGARLRYDVARRRWQAVVEGIDHSGASTTGRR